MAELETQVGQIFISDKKLSRSFISLYSENLQGTGSEAFLLIEIPVLNPAIWPEYESMSELLWTSLLRNMSKLNPNSFENAVAQINDDLAAVASEGQTTWIGKLSACVAAKVHDTVYVATTGKVHAYLYREGQLSNIADSEQSNNPLKTFSNFAQGKIKEKDVLILSTPQLFNYISVERLKNLLAKSSIASASEEIGQTVRNSADDDVSFGTFILRMSEAGSAEKSIVDLGKALAGSSTPFWPKLKVPLRGIKNMLASMLLIPRAIKKPSVRMPDMPRVNFKEFFLTLVALFSVNRFKSLPRPKKFFFVAALVFILALIVNLGVVIYSHNHTKKIAGLNRQLDEVENKINNANASFIIHDESRAISSLNDAESQLNAIPDNQAIETRKQQIAAELGELQNSVGHVVNAQPSELLNYSGASVDDIELISDQIYLINHKGSLVAPFTVSKKSLGKDSTLSVPAFKNSAAADGTLFIEDEQGQVYILSSDIKSISKQSITLPSESAAGFEIYGSPQKAYTINIKDNQIAYGNVKAFQGLANYLKDNTRVSNAIDMAIDGSIYVLTTDGVVKFTKGIRQDFADLGLHFAGNARIKAGLRNIYIADPGSKKIIVETKNGQIVQQYASDKFDNIKDIVVDEGNRILYVFSGSRLFSIRLQQ